MTFNYNPIEHEGEGAGFPCVVPGCGKPANARGLCKSCAQAWKRRGLAGLNRRSERLEFGIDKCTTRYQALELLATIYEKRQDAAEDDQKYYKLTSVLIAVCLKITQIEQRRARERQEKKQLRQAAKVIVSLKPTRPPNGGQHEERPDVERRDDHGRGGGQDDQRVRQAVRDPELGGGGEADRDRQVAGERPAEVRGQGGRGQAHQEAGGQEGQGQEVAAPGVAPPPGSPTSRRPYLIPVAGSSK